MKITQEMIDYCRNLGKSKIEPERMELGLCFAFMSKFDMELSNFINFSKYYKGCNPVYPVVGGRLKYFLSASLANEMWSNKTKYGKDRRKFCLWCADELEALIEETK